MDIAEKRRMQARLCFCLELPKINVTMTKLKEIDHERQF